MVTLPPPSRTRNAACRVASAGFALAMLAAWLLLDRPSGGMLETLLTVALELTLPLALLMLLQAALGARAVTAARVPVAGTRS